MIPQSNFLKRQKEGPAARQQKDPATMKDLMEPSGVHVGSTRQAIAMQTVYEYTPMSRCNCNGKQNAAA